MNFDNLDIDAVKGAEIMNLLGISPYMLNDPQTFGKVKEVMSYMKNLPDTAFFVSRITTGKVVPSRLDHVWSYIQVLNKKEDAQNKLMDIEKNLRSYSEKELSGQLTDIEKSLAQDTIKSKDSVNEELGRIKEEVFIYEK